MGLLDLASGSYDSTAPGQEEGEGGAFDMIKSLATGYAAQKLATMGLGAVGISNPVVGALLGAGLYGAYEGWSKGKSPWDTLSEEMVPSAMYVGGAELGMKAIGNPLWKSLGINIPALGIKALRGGVDTVTGEVQPESLLQSLRRTGISNLLSSGDARWEALKPLREEFFNNEVVPGTFLQKLLKGKTYGDLFVPPQEGIPTIDSLNPLKDFMVDQIGRSRTADLSKNLGKQIENLGMDERVALQDVMENAIQTWKNAPKETNILEKLSPSGIVTTDSEAWANLSLEGKDRVLTALKPFEQFNSTLKNVYLPHQYNFCIDDFAQQFEKAVLNEDVSFTQNLAPGLNAVPNAQRFQAELQQARDLSNTGDIKGARKLMRKIAEKANGDPTLDITLKNNILFLADTPAIMASEVYQAGIEATRNTLFDQIKRYEPYLADSQAAANLKGYIKITGPAAGDFKGMWVEPNIAKSVMALAEIPSEARQMWNKYFFSPWKLWRVIGRPASIVRNAFNNIIMNDMLGEVSLGPVQGFRTYLEAFSDFKSGGPVTRELGKLANVNFAGFSGLELKELNHAVRTGSGMFDVLLNYSNKAAEPFVGFNNFMEGWAKVAKFMANKEAGMEAFPAAVDAMRSTFNYGEVTRFTKFARESFAPFATWQVKMLRALPEAIVKRPITFAKYVAIPYSISKYALDNMNISDGEWQQIKSDLPQYAKDKMFMLMPWRDDNGKLQLFDLTWWLPGLGDLSEMDTRYTSPAGVMQNPAWTIPAALYTNKKMNSSPIWYDWQDPNTKFAKGMTYIYQQLAPTWIPGGTDFSQIWNAAWEKPNALTVTQSIAANLGFKVMPFLESDIAAKKANLDKMYERELIGQLKKELQSAQSEAETQAILRRYQGWLQNLYSPGTATVR